MLKKISLAFCLACALFLPGCNKSQTTENGNAAANANKAMTSNSPAMTTNPATNTNSSTTATAGKIGVPECDEFLAKYDACVSGKVPATIRAQYMTGSEQWRKSWAALAANPSAKAKLAQACKTAEENARPTMKSYGCDF